MNRSQGALIINFSLSRVQYSVALAIRHYHYSFYFTSIAIVN